MFAIYPGSFDPITNGHIDVIKAASTMFDQVQVVIAENPAKAGNYLFTAEEREAMIRIAVGSLPGVIVERHSGLIAKYCQVIPFVIIKGVRFVSDFDSELQQALANREINPGAQTIWIPTSKEHMFLSSSLVRTAAANGEDVSNWVPACVSVMLREKYKVL
jgi:pantetheine-phosphate adenylyltransferase